MRVFDKDKKTELTEFDKNKGRLVPETLTVHVAARPYVPEKCHYETVKEYPNGGKDVVRIVDVPCEPAVPEHDETQDILVYIPYSDDELAVMEKHERILSLKAELEKIKEDIEQENFGIVRDDYSEKKSRAAQIVNELRSLEGKPIREIV
ncbi:MAG: hypothetical protein J1F39_04395 [Clostridiales bacterium]|nr:hypothetical protein [Clostridiales bacterium]